MNINSEQFEKICEAVHNSWWEEKKKQGVTDHPDMIPYSELSEDVKEYDRVTTRAVLNAVDEVTRDNKPLTIEQLREMDGEPVWVSCTDFGGWVLCNGNILMNKNGNGISVEELIGDSRINGVYRYKPEQEGKDVL